MAAAWAEVDKALSEGRRELVLTGPSVAQRLLPENGGKLDERIFSIVNLNFLEISKSGLERLPDLIARLENLTNLGLDNNALSELPPAIGLLKKLKFLDVSFNQLTSLPVELGSLKDLQTLNVIHNKLTSFIDIGGMVQLHALDVSHNELTELPEGITNEQLNLLATVAAHHNQMVSLPAELYNLSNLKLLDVSDNKIEEIPPEFCDCGKLKDLKYGGNKLKDKRLAKMVNGCSTKAVLDYLKNIRDKELKASGGKKPAGVTTAGGSGDKEKKKKGKNSNAQESTKAQSVIKVLHCSGDTGLTIQVTPATASVRPYIVCCIVRNVNFVKSESMMKRFLYLQTKLHDTICAKRQSATIATHDLEAIKGPITFDARIPNEIKLTPLKMKREVTASNLVAHLRKEAEALRKETKRSTVSGIHKYLDLLKDKALYPCLVDASDTVISFPPITNCNSTKVLRTTRHILVEVTSSVSLDICKKVMEELLEALLHMGIGQLEEPPRVLNLTRTAEPTAGTASSIFASLPAEDNDVAGDDDDDKESEVTHEEEKDGSEGGGLEEPDAPEEPDTPDVAVSHTEQVLVVEQVKVIDHMGGLRIVYPSRVDLKSKTYAVTRDYE